LPVSIRDVAAKAGVSLATVSKVLNDRSGSRIAVNTQTRVRETAAALGYQPNRFARGIAVRRTDTLALLISGLQNPFFLSVLEESEKQLMSVGYQVIVDAAPSIDGTYVTHGKLRGWPVDGALMWGGGEDKLSSFLGTQSVNLPVVYLGYRREDQSSWVAFDLYQGGKIAAKYLIDKGYTRLGFVHPWDTSDEQRFPAFHGFQDACRSAQSKVDIETIRTVRYEETQRSGLETGLRIASMPAQNRPQAVMCHNDVIAIGLYHGLIRGGLRVPEDIALVGFDGIEEGQCLDKPLTTIHTPVDQFCRKAIDILLSKLSGGPEWPNEQCVLPAKLLRGETA